MAQRDRTRRVRDDNSESPESIWRVDGAPGARNAKSRWPTPIWRPVHVEGRGDAAIARVAAAQKGVVTRAQLLAAGLGAGAIRHRLNRARLHPTRFRGVYVVGHLALAPMALEMAAIASFDGYAVISHRCAASLWGLVPAHAVIEVTTFGPHRDSSPGLTVYRVADLDRRDVRLRSAVPVTAPARTILDFAGQATGQELERAVDEARVQRIVSEAQIEAAIDRSPRRAGAHALRALTNDDHRHGFSQSEAERKMRALVRKAGLPSPQANVSLLGFRVDFLWPDERLVVEVDGHRAHSGGARFESDRRRDQVLVAAGYRVIRVTWRQITREPFAVIARIAQALQVAVA